MGRGKRFRLGPIPGPDGRDGQAHPGRFARRREAAGEGGIEVVVGVDQTRCHQTVRRIDRVVRGRWLADALAGLGVAVRRFGDGSVRLGLPADRAAFARLWRGCAAALAPEALLLDLQPGDTVIVPTPGGNIKLKVPAGSANGKKLRIKGKGIPSKMPGDLYVVIQIVWPPSEDQHARKIYEEMKTLNFNPRTNFKL